MWYLCLIGIFSSGSMILSCCCECFGHIANILNIITGIAQLAMLIGGSIWRFSRKGMACAVNGTSMTTAKAELKRNVGKSAAAGLKAVTKKGAKYASDAFKKGLSQFTGKKKTNESQDTTSAAEAEA